MNAEIGNRARNHFETLCFREIQENKYNLIILSVKAKN